MKKIYFLVMLVVLGSALKAQTNPAAFDLSSGNFTFTGFGAGTTTTYPASMQGHKFAAEPTAATTTSVVANGDQALVVSTGSITTGSIRNEIANGLSLLNSGSNNIGAIVVALNTTGRTTITATFTAEQLNSGGSGATDRINGMRLQYRVGTSGAFTDIAGTEYLTTNTASLNAAQTFSSIAIPAACDNQPVVQLRWIYYISSGTVGSRDRIRLDDITVASSVSAAPSIVTSATSLASFGAIVFGNNSVERTYDVSGTNLTANLNVTAPANVEVSLTSGSYTGITGNTIPLTPSSGTVATTPIYARFSPATASGFLNANITNTSTGATTKNVNVQGFGVDNEPTIQSAITFGTVTTSTIDVNFSGGNGTGGRVLVIKAGSAVNADPADGPAYLDGGGLYANGTDLGTGNYVVYYGNLNTATVTGLTPGTTYHFAVYEFNDNGGTIGAANYLTPGGTNNITTVAPTVGLQLATANTSYKIDFDHTITGSNTGSFNGTNINTSESDGTINSNAWSINDVSATAAATFGGTYTGTGLQNPGVSIASNFFGMNIGAGNVALGIQPTGAYFSPGNVTLKIQNQTGSTINKLNLSYIFYVVNDQDRSSTFNFAYSSDNSTYTNVTSLDYTSPTSLVGTNLLSQYRSTEITGLSIPAGGYVYLRWYGDDVAGSGSRDEFALDDIEIIANSTSVIPTIGGNLENAIINSNTSAAANATVSSGLNFVNGKITLGNNSLTVGGSVTGASSSNYVITNGTGTLTINNVGSTPVLFPVGPDATLYHPATVSNAGTADNFSVRVSSAAPPCATAITSVNAVWDIAEAVAGGSDCAITLDYTGATTGGSYDAAMAQIVHCTGAVADYHNGSVTGTVASGSGFTTFSPFVISNDLTVLPVNFTAIKASQQTGGVKVEWSNLTETEMLSYSVERSADGSNFSSIATVAANLNNGGRADYIYLDATATDGVNYYRIIAKAVNGSTKYSSIVKVNTKGGKTEMAIYPNPVSGNRVSFQASSLPKGQYTVRVINAGGQVIYSKQLLHNGGAVTEVVELPSSVKTGMYSLQLAGGEVNLVKTFIVR